MIAQMKSKLFMVLLLVVFCLMAVVPAFAQTNTPVPPTAVPSIPTLAINPGVIFTSTNQWISALDELIAVGLGISIALAILGLLGHQLLKAFGSARR